MADRPQKITLQDTLAQQSERKQHRNSNDAEESGLGGFFAWGARLSLLLAVCCAPWMIASINPGAQLVLASILLVGLASWWIETALASGKKQIIPYIVLIVMLGMGIGFFQTVKLPESLAGMAAGRQIEIAEKYLSVANAESGPPVRLSMDVEGTWYQLRLLVIALVCLLLGSRYFRTTNHLAVFLTTVVVNGVALTAFGLVQKFRFNGKLFWEIELTQGGSPFGPFVCRNNAAGYLVMCLSAGAGLLLLLMTKKENSRPHQIVSKEIPVWRQVSTYLRMFLAELDAKRLAVIVACIFISIGVVVTLSRGGVIALLAAWIGGSIIYNITRKPKFAGLLMAPIAILVFALVSWIGFADDVVSRFDKLDTLGETTVDARLNTWRDTLPAAFENGWLGTGLGSYRAVHRLYRTDPERKLFIYAENQYVQTIVEAGIPGLCLLACALLLGFWYVFFLLNRGSSGVTIGAGVFGAFLLCGQVFAAIFDFGWYVPANMVLFAAGIGVVAFHAHSLAGRLKKKTWLRFESPAILNQAIILVAFLLSIFVVYDLYNKAAIYDEVKPNSMVMRDPSKVDLEDTDARISRLSPLVNKDATTQGLNMMGDLYVHRARLQYLDLLKEQAPEFGANLDSEGREQIATNLWNLTGLVRMHEYVSILTRQDDVDSLRRFRQQEFFQYDLPQALIYYRTSQQTAPLQPRAQLMIGILSSMLKDFDKATLELEKTIELSPQNPDHRFSTALVLLQQGEVESGTVHLAYYLTLAPKSFPMVMDIATGKSTRQVVPLDDRAIFETLIGENPKQLYLFGKNYLGNNPRLKKEVLQKANGLLTDISLSDFDSLKLKADINFEAGDWETGIEFLDATVRSNPNDQDARLQLAESLVENGQLEEAKSHVEKLLRINNRSAIYNKLFKRIEQEIEKAKNEKDGDAAFINGVPGSMPLFNLEPI